MPPTILATIELGRGNGHVAITAPLARALGRRGWPTALATRDLMAAARVPDRPFARLLQAPVAEPALPIPTLTYGQAIADGGFHSADQVTVLVAAWLQLFDLLRPAGIAAEHAPASLLAAHVARLPAVRVAAAWAAPPATRPGVSLMPWQRDDPAARTKADALADEIVRIVCRRFDAPPLDGLAALLGGAPRFLATWPETDHFGASDAAYYGPMTGLAATARPPWPDGQGPRVFVYLPGDHPVAPALAAALAALGWPALWHGAGLPPMLAANIAFSPVPVDLRQVLPGAALLVGRGGHATACEAVRAGVPQVIVPDTLESALLGWQLERQRLARLSDAAPDAASLQAAMTATVADAAMAAAARAAAARHARYDPNAAEDRLAGDVLTALGLI